ncbi:hypothetical protein, partial [Mesorhizobium sp.]|uniref:hypothetical protein n=1 Tax=Mesorhizobium sp. TaxID=1871066 RepID=UPI0025BEFB0C
EEAELLTKAAGSVSRCRLARPTVGLRVLNRLKQLFFRSPAALEHVDKKQGRSFGVRGPRLATALAAQNVKHALQHVEVFWIKGIRRQVPLHLSVPVVGESALVALKQRSP